MPPNFFLTCIRIRIENISGTRNPPFFVHHMTLFMKARGTEAGRPTAERERRERGRRAAREGGRAAQGRHQQRQAGRQVVKPVL